MTHFDALSPETMHRGAKLFMDRGDAITYDDALETLRSFRVGIMVGNDVAASEGAQLALLTAVNVASRSFLGGVQVVRCPRVALKTAIVAAGDLQQAVLDLGGRLVDDVELTSPVLLIGDVAPPASARTVLRVTWQGWSGGVAPAASGIRLAETGNVNVAPIMAAAIAVGEVFQALAGRTAYAAFRTTGFSLWSPGADWTDPGAVGGDLLGLPAGFWLIGLGNLGQAFLWCIGALPYGSPEQVSLILQDDDNLQPSNESTSVLSDAGSTGRKKTRVMAEWAERLGFTTRIVERRFGPWTRRSEEAEDPAVAFCGVDNAQARMTLEEAGFPLVVEAGLGAGPHAYCNWATHCFPGGRKARDIWLSMATTSAPENLSDLPAYHAAGAAGLDECGVLQLATRTVGVPFVGLTAAAVAVGELLRRMHGGPGFDVIAGSMASLEDVEFVQASKEVIWLHGMAATR